MKEVKPKKAAKFTVKCQDKFIEVATTDAYNESEQVSGLFALIEDNLVVPFTTRVLGQVVTYESIRVPASPEKYYLGIDGAYWGNKTELLGCICGNSGCWPLLCKIDVQSDKIVWSEFEQPHRDDYWDYSSFQGFVFDKQQYMKAIEALSRSVLALSSAE